MQPIELDFPPDAIVFWVIYEYPTDYPDLYVLRAQWVAKGGGDIIRSGKAWTADSAQALREILPPGLFRLGQHPSDDPKIYEVWI